MQITFCPEKKDYIQALESNYVHERRKKWFVPVLSFGFCLFAIALVVWVDGWFEGLVANPLTWPLLIYLLFFAVRQMLDGGMGLIGGCISVCWL